MDKSTVQHLELDALFLEVFYQTRTESELHDLLALNGVKRTFIHFHEKIFKNI